MTFAQPDPNMRFLHGGGEMGKSIRNKDWTKTSLGSPHTWPQSLKTTLSIILNSGHPMLLWWGPDLICFYNDSSQPILLGNSSHQQILGLMGKNTGITDWNYIEPLIEKVLDSGEPIFANGQISQFAGLSKEKNIYLRFCYSAVTDESGKPGGVLMTCTEVAETPVIYNSPEEKNEENLNSGIEQIFPVQADRDRSVATEMEVSEKHAAPEDLEENDQKLNIVVAASDLAVWELNLKTRVAKYSNRYLEIFGYPKGTVLTHQQILQHLHPDDLPIREKAFEEAFSSGILHYEARLIWNDKSLHWIEGKGKVFFAEDGTPTHLIGTLRDITEEKNYQKDLEEREQKFRLLADSMPQHVWTSDSQGNLNYYNKAVFEYSGLNLEEFQKNGWMQIVHPDDREENMKQWAESVATGADFLFEHRFRKHTGEYRWQLSRAIPQRDQAGAIRMWVGTSTDIQDQKYFAKELENQVLNRTRELEQLNEDLKKSEERYHLMVEEVQDYAILYLNREGVVENWNAGAEKIKGYRADEIVGRNFSTFYTDGDRKDGLPGKLLNLALKTGRAVQEGWRVRKDGSFFWASVVITAVHNQAKEVIGFSKVTHDLTEKKEASDRLIKNAAELEQKNADLKKMNKELEAFAYISSHDLQEPLRKIQTFATRIAAKELENLSEYGKDYFARMQKAAARMQTLIDDLLAYSRTTTTERKYESADLKEIVDEVKKDLQEELQQKSASIEVGEMCTIEIIPFQFRQLLYNLIGNSLKFSTADRDPYIKIESRIADGSKFKNDNLSDEIKYCHIRIADNGIGFEQQYSEKIFELFQRLHNRTHYEGTGIGLAIVKKIVDNHCGVIMAKGEVNKGATFDIYLPVY